MNENSIPNSLKLVLSEDTIDSLYPMFFGVSCAFSALKLIPDPEICEDQWLEIRNMMLKGSAHLMGLLIWKIQKEKAKTGKSELLQTLESSRKQIEELKKMRSEDGKANEKVVSIVASREHSWFSERKELREQIDDLMNELRAIEISREKSISESNDKLREIEEILLSKDQIIEEGDRKRREIEENLNQAENVANELREKLNQEARRHSNEIRRHKKAFIELVSNQRQLEAEMGRTLRQFESAKQELDSVLDQKDQSVLMAQTLSMELVKMRKDLERKDQILSAILRKSKLDTDEKEMLLKEARSSNVMRKQAEIETATWKTVSDNKPERHSLRSMLSKRVNVRSDVFSRRKGVRREVGKGIEVPSLVSDPFLTDEPKIIAGVIERLENSVTSEAEMYKTAAIEQRHNMETDAFAEQLRLKDEEIEAFRWRLLSMDIESKRLHSHIENLDHDITNLRRDNVQLEALLIDRESQLHSLKEQLVLQFSPPSLQKMNFDPSPHEASVNHKTVWSEVKVVKRRSGEKMQEMYAIAEENSRPVENEKINEISNNEQVKDIKYQVTVGSGSTKRSNSAVKMDIQALGVSYKIKRLKQQFVMLERLTGKQESSEDGENGNGHFEIKGFYALISLLNKHVDRYQSLQGKADDLCQRMQQQDDLKLNCGGSAIAKTEDETKRLEQFLEETFQLQRYIVATGQKLVEVQAKIASGFVIDAEKLEKPESFDMKRFVDSIRALFQEVQKGLEIRISRTIGDLEGTLACDGIIHFKK
ncbi:hypothetical protein OROGR_022552 [Orobanche gracilis]